MKLNNKGFAITLVLYGTFILFLLLIVSMLGILSTYKLRLEKLTDKTEEIITPEPDIHETGELTCRITNYYYDSSDGWISIELTVSDETLLHSENPYCYGSTCKDTARFDKEYSNSWEKYEVKVKDQAGNEIKCGETTFSVGSWGYHDTEYYCTNTYAVPEEDVRFGGTSYKLLGSYDSSSEAWSACTARCQPPQYEYSSGCNVGVRVYRSCSNVDGTECTS